MSDVASIQVIDGSLTSQQLAQVQSPQVENNSPSQVNFSELLKSGFQELETKVDKANELTREFALDGSSVPVHEVSVALEEARMAVEMALYVRNKLTEGYREIMNMQV